MELFFLIVCLFAVEPLVAMATHSKVEENPERDEITDCVIEARKGDKQAFSNLVLAFQTRIYNLTLNYVKRPEEAEDLTQDIFITVFKSLPKLNDVTKFSAWLYQIAINHCRNRFKKLKRKGFFTAQSLDDPDNPIQVTGGENPEQKIENQNLLQILMHEISLLSEAEKEILILRDIQELSYEEIGEILGIPLGTVKSKLNRSRNSLKDRLKKIL